MNVIAEELELCHTESNELKADEAFARLLRHAMDLPASDVFLSWNEDDVTVSVRHLGILRRVSNVTRVAGGRIVTYVKASAGMDVARKYRPQDGRWVCAVEDGKKVDLRISTIPTLYGEDMSIRLLERSTGLLEINNLGFHRKSLYELTSLLGVPGGLLLMTGPSGSGKTTTLYACMNHLNDGTRKINTIEDPIEYMLPGVHQSQVNAKIGLDFPELLRSVLRQSADVIMIGEVRDPLTAETAVRAANSGHLVFATLHAPVAAEAIDSMLALGVDSHFLATSLLGIVSQRLVRTLCTDCRMAFDVGPAVHTFDSVRKWLEPGQGDNIYGAPGCRHCRHEGYVDRTGVVEVLRVTPEIRRLVLQQRPAREIHDAAVRQGMIDLRRAALLKVAQGVTSTKDLVRLIPAEHVTSTDRASIGQPVLQPAT